MESSICFLDENISEYLTDNISELKRKEIILYFENLKEDLCTLIDLLSTKNFFDMMPKIVGINRKMEVLFTFIEFYENNLEDIEEVNLIEIVEEDYIKFHWDQLSENTSHSMTKSLFYRVE